MNAPKLRFKEFNDEWKNKKLLELVSFSKGNLLSKSDLDDNGIYPCILYGQLYTKYHEVIRNVYSKTSNSSNNITKSKYGDILIPSSGETPIDISTSSCLLLDNILLGGDINILSPINCDGRFISYMINNNKRTEIAKVAQGHSIVHLYNENLKKVNLQIPTMNEQIKIANALELLDKKIELQTKKIQDLKLFTKNTISNELNNLQNYNISKFKDICNIQTGKSNTQDKCDDGIYPFYIRSENIERSNNYIFDCEAVLTIGDGNIGKVFFYENGKFDCHQRVYVLNNFKNVLGKYVYYYFSSFFYKRAMSMSAKNTVDSVRMEMISDMIIKVPQEKEQIKMINLFSSLDKKLELEQNKLDKLQELKKGLMQNMFV